MNLFEYVQVEPREGTEMIENRAEPITKPNLRAPFEGMLKPVFHTGQNGWIIRVTEEYREDVESLIGECLHTKWCTNPVQVEGIAHAIVGIPTGFSIVKYNGELLIQFDEGWWNKGNGGFPCYDLMQGDMPLLIEGVCKIVLKDDVEWVFT